MPTNARADSGLSFAGPSPSDPAATGDAIPAAPTLRAQAAPGARPAPHSSRRSKESIE